MKSDYSEMSKPNANRNDIAQLCLNLVTDKLNIGDVVIGEIIIQPMRELSITKLDIKITSKEGWGISGFFSNRESLLDNELLKQSIDLSSLSPNQNGIVTLLPNKYVIPFNFDISHTFIPSFRYPLQAKTAFLYHSFTVEMTSLTGERWTSTKPIAIISLYNRPTAPQIQESTKEVLLMNLFSQGSNRVSASFSHTVYKYNDIIAFDVFIDNSNCKATVNKIEYVLMRKIVFKQNGVEKFKLEKKMNQQSDAIQVLPNEKRTIQGAIQFKNNDDKEFEGSDPNMYLPRCNDLNELVTSVATSLIYCEYYLNFYISYTGMTKNEGVPRIMMPIFTGRLKTDKNEGNSLNDTPKYEDINKINDEFEMVPAQNCIDEMMSKKQTDY